MVTLSTARLRLEPLNSGHAEEMLPVLSDPAIHEFLDYGAPGSLEELRALYVKQEAGRSPDGSQLWLNWLVRLESGQAIGYVQATVYPREKTYVGYVFASVYWGKGYATEAMSSMLSLLALEHPTPLVMAVVEAENVRSSALLFRLGFKLALPRDSGASALSPTERLYILSPSAQDGR
jgi:RimJ/RimL family protein N-acetyltransferase